jgi:predicted DsbA family dithiol-disulfide isomerase
VRPTLTVEVWSDVVCPWCYIGKRRFEKAAAALRDEVDLEVVYRPYQLDPRAPVGATMPVEEAYARKFGGLDAAQRAIAHVTTLAADEGLEFRMDRALRANTMHAHRLLFLAEGTGHQAALKERLLQAYFCDGLDVGDAGVLAELASEVGMPADKVAAFLASRDGADEVAQMIGIAQDNGINAVPTYVLDGRFMIPGAQDPDTFVNVIRRVLARRSEESS